MRNQLLSTSTAIALLLVAAPGQAEPLTYEHDGEPLFTITYPDSWYYGGNATDDEESASGRDGALRILQAMPNDDTRLWFGVWVAPAKVTTLDEGLDYLASLDGDLFTDVEATEPQPADFNGMPARTFFGTARRQDQDVEYAVAVFLPRDGTVAAVLYVGLLDTWKKHESQLREMVASISPIAD